MIWKRRNKLDVNVPQSPTSTLILIVTRFDIDWRSSYSVSLIHLELPEDNQEAKEQEQPQEILHVEEVKQQDGEGDDKQQDVKCEQNNQEQHISSTLKITAGLAVLGCAALFIYRKIRAD